MTWQLGDSTDDNNYTAICLSSIVFKLYTRIVVNRLKNLVEVKMEDENTKYLAAEIPIESWRPGKSFDKAA